MPFRVLRSHKTSNKAILSASSNKGARDARLRSVRENAHVRNARARDLSRIICPEAPLGRRKIGSGETGKYPEHATPNAVTHIFATNNAFLRAGFIAPRISARFLARVATGFSHGRGPGSLINNATE